MMDEVCDTAVSLLVIFVVCRHIVYHAVCHTFVVARPVFHVPFVII